MSLGALENSAMNCLSAGAHRSFPGIAFCISETICGVTGRVTFRGSIDPWSLSVCKAASSVGSFDNEEKSVMKVPLHTNQVDEFIWFRKENDHSEISL